MAMGETVMAEAGSTEEEPIRDFKRIEWLEVNVEHDFYVQLRRLPMGDVQISVVHDKGGEVGYRGGTVRAALDAALRPLA
jgi:hypothetical protein